ncbi:MAG: FHA domain-containing protein, partial [Anaerolineales bacterium]
VDGDRHFPLSRPVINIGRRLDNHLIIEDQRISRTHAQIRIRAGRFEIFDLNSSAGTLVNGRAVNHHILQPGDVIALADTRLVYGEDPGGPPDETPVYAPPFPPRPAGDQKTHIIDRNEDDEEEEER